MAVLLPSRDFDVEPATLHAFFVPVFAFAACFAGLPFPAGFRFGVVCSAAPLVSLVTDSVFIVGVPFSRLIRGDDSSLRFAMKASAKMHQDRKSKLRRDLTN